MGNNCISLTVEASAPTEIDFFSQADFDIWQKRNSDNQIIGRLIKEYIMNKIPFFGHLMITTIKI